MEAAADFVAAFVELAAGVEHRHNNFQSRAMLFRVFVNRDAAAVVLNYDAVVFAYSHLHVCAVACQGFVDTVVHSFIYEVVQTFLADVSDIHGWALAHCLKSFEHLNTLTGIIFFRSFLFFCHIECLVFLVS